MCIGCRRRSQQRSLVRFTVAGGAVVVDADQRLPGRGAYVCGRTQCATRVISDGRRLVHALRTTRDRVIVDTEALLQDWKVNRRDDAAGSAPPNGMTVAEHTHNAERAQDRLRRTDDQSQGDERRPDNGHDHGADRRVGDGT